MKRIFFALAATLAVAWTGPASASLILSYTRTLAGQGFGYQPTNEVDTELFVPVDPLVINFTPEGPFGTFSTVPKDYLIIFHTSAEITDLYNAEYHYQDFFTTSAVVDGRIGGRNFWKRLW